MTTEAASLRDVLAWMATDPWEALGRRWNYKSALLSASTRGLLFFASNLSGGWEAAGAALLVELGFRFGTAGFYGAITQGLQRVRPERTGTWAAVVALPVVSHSLEWLVHWTMGTGALARSIALSVAFTGLSTAFHLFAMRQGVFVVGPGSRSLSHDLSQVPRMLGAFVSGTARAIGGAAARARECR